MQHAIESHGAGTLISFAGEVDLEQSPKARQILLTALEEQRPLYVDLSQVAYIDSSGVASLVEAFQIAKRKDLVFELVRVSDAAMRVFELARLDRVFVIRDGAPETVDGKR